MTKYISLREAYNILESLYPKHFTIHNAYVLNSDIDKDFSKLDKWEELYEQVLEIENSFGINNLENKIAKCEQILHYFDCNLNDIPYEYAISAKERIKDLKAEIQLYNEKLNFLQDNTKFETYEDLINE